MAQLISNDKMKPKKLIIQFKRRVDSSWSWVVCLAAFIVQFFVVGTINSFGSFFVALLQEYQGSEGATAWIGSLVVGLTFISGPIVTSFCDRWGCRVVMCIGSVAFMAGMLLSSIVSHLSLMYITYSLLLGVAGGCAYYSSFYAIVLHFNKHLAVATGIMFAGSGAGTMAISFVIDKCISQHGLRMTFQAMAAVSVLLILAALTFVPVDLEEGDKKLWPQKATVETKTGMTARQRIYGGLRSLLWPSPVWKNKAFVVWTITLCLTLIAYYIPYVFLVRLAEDIGIPTTEGALFVGYCALAQVLGKIFFGKLAESTRVSRLTIIQTALLVMAVASCLCPLARSHTALLTYAVVLGFFDGCVVVLLGLVTQDIVGREMVAKAVGTMYAAVAIPMTVGPPMAGLLHDKTGNYNIVFFVASGLVTSGVCLMFLIPVLLPPKRESRQVILPDCTKISDSTSVELHGGGIADDKFIGYEELDRLSHTSSEDRNRLLLETPSFESRPSSFILFSIVTAESFRDLSSPNDRYSNSRATSRTSLAKVCELKVESRSNSCVRLEPLKENEDNQAIDASTFDCTLLDALHVIVEPSTEITRSLSLDNFKDNDLIINVPEIQADFMDKDGVSKIISKSTESGFISEDSVNEISEVSKNADEKRLSCYSWNSTSSDLSWKFYSEGETDDSGFAEVATPPSTETHNGELEATVDRKETGASGNLELLESNMYESSGSCACSFVVNPKVITPTMPGSTNAKEFMEGPLTLDCCSQPFQSQLEDVCACGKAEESQLLDGSKSKNATQVNEHFVDELPQPPDIFSQMFEGILEDVNEYVQIFSELPIHENSLKIWPGEIATDLQAQGRETEV